MIRTLSPHRKESTPSSCSSPRSEADMLESMSSPKTTTTTNQIFLRNKQHMTLVCEHLINSGKFDRLERFLWAIPDIEKHNDPEIILIARSYLAFRCGHFHRLYELLQRRPYSKKYHRQLQYLWRTARYVEAEKTRGRALGSVGKYRVRRKYPLPDTIWDGECISYCFREESRNILNATYKHTPYPTAKEKYAIAQDANLSVTQVSNWFKNKRQRARAKKAENKER